MTKFLKGLLSVALAIGFGLTTSAAMAAGNSTGKAPRLQDFTGNPVIEALTFFNSFDVIQVSARTSGSLLVIDVRDCCIVGDQWAARTVCYQNGAVWDVRGIGRGDTGSFSGITTVYRSGSQAIDCLTEIRYSQGVSIFPAGLDVRWTTSGGLVTTEVQNVPVPLPSS